MSGTRSDADKVFDRFITTYKTKWPAATDYLEKDRAELLAFYGFPAEHCHHLPTSNRSKTLLQPCDWEPTAPSLARLPRLWRSNSRK